MSLHRSLIFNALPQTIVDGWTDVLSLAANARVKLSTYANAIDTNVAAYLVGNSETSPTTITEGEVIIPIVFHLVLDSPELVSPSGGGTINFDVSAILEDVNNSFSSANIKFCPVINDPSLVSLDIPGVNIIDASTLTQTRDNNGKSITESYIENGIAATPYRLESDGTVSYNSGITLESLYTNHSWDSSKVINVFLINSFSGTESSGNTTSMSANPYIYDMLTSTKFFNITIPFWALGNPWESVEYPGYGYKYLDTRVATDFVTKVYDKIYIAAETSIINYYGIGGNKSKPLIKSLGHLFGLASINTFHNTLITTDSNYTLNSCNTSCVYTDLFSQDYCGDCCSDTTTNKIHIPYAGDIGDHSCDDDIEFKYNPMSDYVVEDTVYAFTLHQILSMRANIGLVYVDDVDPNQMTSGVLGQLATSAAQVLCEDEVEGAPEYEACDNVRETVSRQVVSNANIYTRLRTFQSKSSKEYFKIITIIKNITNKFI
tara:strand:+ start:716 stop:2185 length:1470 start_codon:yes stop_codon:yes gene_type:complete